MRLGLLGGSFDPIHNAHLIVAQCAYEALGLDRIVFLVSGAQPLKPGHRVPGEARLAMVERAIAGVGHFAADGREVRRGGPSYTVDTLRELRDEQPETQLTLLLGSDSAAGFSRWRAPEAIRRLARVAVVARPGTPVPAGFDGFPAPVMELSSSAIRVRAAAGLSLRGWVPEPVADYISGLSLYQNSGGAA